MSDDIPEEPLDPDLVLSEHTINALKEFYSENSWRLNSEDINQNNGYIEENWQLSQFWYTEETADYLSDQIINALNISNDNNLCDTSPQVITKSIACISCPTLFDSLYKKLNKLENISIVLLEFDKRFQTKYVLNYVFYDYKNPIDYSIKEKFSEKSMDAVIADPPFLSEECLRKTSETIKYLAKDKVLVCTGALMRDLIKDCLQLEECDHFEPKHNRKLGNEFKCFSNFELKKIQNN